MFLQLIESPLPFLRRFQDYCSETKLIIAKAENEVRGDYAVRGSGPHEEDAKGHEDA